MLPVLLPACGPSAAPQPTVTPIGLPPTWTPPVIATGLPTATEIPTFTPVPAFTPMSTATRDPASALSERFQNSLFSPNGRWTAYRDPDKPQSELTLYDAIRIHFEMWGVADEHAEGLVETWKRR